MATASDGHACRSLLDLHVEEYLIAAGIPHEPEPTYPYHSRLNASGMRRADWLLGGQLWVEAAGMIREDEYDVRLREKQELAAELGLRLVVITPTDIPKLHQLLPANEFMRG